MTISINIGDLYHILRCLFRLPCAPNSSAGSSLVFYVRHDVPHFTLQHCLSAILNLFALQSVLHQPTLPDEQPALGEQLAISRSTAVQVKSQMREKLAYRPLFYCTTRMSIHSLTTAFAVIWRDKWHLISECAWSELLRPQHNTSTTDDADVSLTTE